MKVTAILRLNHAIWCLLCAAPRDQITSRTWPQFDGDLQILEDLLHGFLVLFDEGVIVAGANADLLDNRHAAVRPSGNRKRCQGLTKFLSSNSLAPLGDSLGYDFDAFRSYD